MLHSDLKQTVVELLRGQEKIKAIKYVRDRLNIGLREATRLVEVAEHEAFPERQKAGPVPLVGWIFAGSGVLFFLLVVFFIWKDLQMTRNSTKVEGIVTSLEYQSGGSSVPVVRYHYLGKERTLHGQVQSTPPAFEVGEAVELLISNRDENQVTINSFFERFFLIVFFSIFTVVFGGIGWVLVVKKFGSK